MLKPAVPLATGGGGGTDDIPPEGTGLGPLAAIGGGGGIDPGIGGGGALGGFAIGAPGGSPCGGGGGGGSGAWGGGGKGLGGAPGAAVPLAAEAGCGGLLASGGLDLKYNCSVNIFESGSQCEKNLGVDLSISVLGTLKATISYGSAANKRY